MKLAWRYLWHDRVRFAVSVLGIAFAVFLMNFQGSLLFGFLRAAGELVEATQSDLWVSARGVSCFDFPSPLPSGFTALVRGVPGVESVNRMVTSFAEYRKRDGQQQFIALVGAEPGVGSAFPLPVVHAAETGSEPNSVVVDRSSRALLEIGELPAEIEINRRRARVSGMVAGFSSFLGSPYVFTSYRDATRYLGVPAEQPMYLLLRLRRGYAPSEVRRELQARLPEVDVWTRAEFAARSRRYWITQTGAGVGILAAAILGFLVGLVVVSQTIYASTMENLEEFATLKALGASRFFVMRVVLAQALLCGVAGFALGTAAVFPLVRETRAAIAWIFTPWWLPVAAVPPTLAMCCLAAVLSVRAALSVEPAKVFRA